MSYFQVVVECEDCGDIETTDPVWDKDDLPYLEDAAEEVGFEHMCMEYECKTLCTYCASKYDGCIDCGEFQHKENLERCDDDEYRCETCRDNHHDNLQEELEDDHDTKTEWVCENCGAENKLFNAKPRWSI